MKANLDFIHGRIAQAADRAGRSPEDITLIAVSKTKPAELIQAAYQYGQRLFGENKVQEIQQKQPVLPKDIQWHMIGHLQTNKVRACVKSAVMIHSVDSRKLALAIEQEAEKENLISDILLEVNIALEKTKYGLAPEEVLPLVRELSEFEHIRVRGLMTVAPYTEEAEKNRKYFQQMKQLFVDINTKNIDNIRMDTLSMGMTGDYEIAIEEGATIVRVGTGVFGERNYNKELR